MLTEVHKEHFATNRYISAISNTRLIISQQTLMDISFKEKEERKKENKREKKPSTVSQLVTTS